MADEGASVEVCDLKSDGPDTTIAAAGFSAELYGADFLTEEGKQAMGALSFTVRMDLGNPDAKRGFMPKDSPGIPGT